MVRNGWHEVKAFKSYSSEWVDANIAAIQFRDTVFGALKGIIDDLPDYDTGYMKIEPGDKEYTIEHGLGGIPKRVIAFFSEVQDPVENKDAIYLHPLGIEFYDSGGSEKIAGLRLIFTNKNTAVIHTGTDSLLHYLDAGFVRLLFWR